MLRVFFLLTIEGHWAIMNSLVSTVDSLFAHFLQHADIKGSRKWHLLPSYELLEKALIIKNDKLINVAFLRR